MKEPDAVAGADRLPVDDLAVAAEAEGVTVGLDAETGKTLDDAGVAVETDKVVGDEIVASNQVENLLRRDADIAIRMVKPAQLDLVTRKIADIPLLACAATT
ncbi:MAG: hypothetical protein ABJC65_07965, partial [Nitratireductor sp.]